MAKSRKQKNKNNRVMSAAYSNSTTIEIPQLTEAQKGFDAQLAAASLLKEAVAKLDEATNTARSDKISALVKQMLPPPPTPPATTTAITELAKTTYRDIKAIEDKAKESKDALVGLDNYLHGQIEQFEEHNCADALAVYRKELAEFLESDAQKCAIEAKIADLEKLCHEPKPAAK
jgi:hypothetical protein